MMFRLLAGKRRQSNLLHSFAKGSRRGAPAASVPGRLASMSVKNRAPSPVEPVMPRFELRATNSGSQEIMRDIAKHDEEAVPCFGFASASCEDNSGVNIECDRGMCDNRRLQRGDFARTIVRPDLKGQWGLYARDRVRKGDFLGEFTGEIIEAETFWSRFEEVGNEDNVYFCHLHGVYVIDATKKGSVARFINHSCVPNSAFLPWTVSRRRRIAVVAMVDIEAGMEITISYHFERGVFEQKCCCGEA